MGRCSPSQIFSMLRLVVTVCLVALVAGGGHGGNKMKKYAHMKIQQSCFGEKYINDEWDKYKASSKKCSTQPQLIATEDIDFTDIIENIRDMALPWGSRSDNEQFRQLGRRNKRHVSDEKHSHTTAGKLYHLQERMACMIGNMTCMMLDQKCMKEDRTPDFDFYTQKIADWTGPQDMTPEDLKEMKDELTWGLDVCKDFSMCISPARAKSPFMKELGHVIAFAKCMEMKKMRACMKKDFKNYAEKAGYAGFDEIIDLGLAGLAKHDKKEKMGINALTMTLSGDMVF